MLHGVTEHVDVAIFGYQYTTDDYTNGTGDRSSSTTKQM